MNRLKFDLLFRLCAVVCGSSIAHAGEVFIEAESFKSTGGWVTESGVGVKDASGISVLSGAGGAKDGVAAATVSVKDAGHYRVWVRYSSHPKWRGPFRLAALQDGRELGGGLFDTAFEGKGTRVGFIRKSFEADLAAGEVTLKFSKHENENCSSQARASCRGASNSGNEALGPEQPSGISQPDFLTMASQRRCICPGVTSSTIWERSHSWPNGSRTRPSRWP